VRPIGAGAITSAAGPFINHLGSTGSLVANTVVGGLAAVAGGGKFENGAITGAFGYLFNSQFHSRTAVPFTDEQNNPILDRDGNRIMRPSDVPPSFFVDAGLAAAAADAGSADAPGMTSRALLLNSVRAQLGMSSESARIRSPLRRLSITQRSGSASMARQQEFLLAKIFTYQNWYASWFSRFNPNTQYDSVYTHLPATNVVNTYTGYRLYQSGLIGSSRSQ